MWGDGETETLALRWGPQGTDSMAEALPGDLCLSSRLLSHREALSLLFRGDALPEMPPSHRPQTDTRRLW